MTKIVHINCGTLLVPTYPTVVCHCLALCDGDQVVLVDCGIGLCDTRDPTGRIGQELIDAAGFQFNEEDTAVRRIEALGINRSQVRNIVLTHADADHSGGLADFPDAKVHIASEELAHVQQSHPRYIQSHFGHDVQWEPYSSSGPTLDWYGAESRLLRLPLSARVLLVPLFGHTLGHCGVAIERDDRWHLHTGDAYYLRDELTDPSHPVSALATARADDDAQRMASLDYLRRLSRDHSDEVTMCGYHDINELPDHCVEQVRRLNSE